MIKGFVFFKEGRITFVIENYRMELFTDDSLLNDFCKQYNFKTDYILTGVYFPDGTIKQSAIFLVKNSIGSTCYLRCYLINIFEDNKRFDAIGLQSPFLDDVFRFRYEYLDMVRAGTNLAKEPKNVYKIPFSMEGRHYELLFRIGFNNRLGLLEDYTRNGEALLALQSGKIQECNDISVVLYRLAMFMTSQAEVPYKKIVLYRDGVGVGWFYSPLISEYATSVSDYFFHDYDVMKYIPRILNNIALDSGNRITKSIPLGHLGNLDSMFSPQRFIEQITAFEYLFEKLDPKKAKDRRFPLKQELEYMLNEFPIILSGTKRSAEEISEQIKETRRSIAHGYTYYYDFNDNSSARYLMLILDRLIKKMSLLSMGFTKDEIDAYSFF